MQNLLVLAELSLSLELSGAKTGSQLGSSDRYIASVIAMARLALAVAEAPRGSLLVARSSSLAASN